MTLFLSEYVSGGEIINSRYNSVHGYLAFHNCGRPVVLQLTGNCEGEMAGTHLRFDVRPDPNGLEPLPVTEEQLNELSLAWMQIGVTAEMTIRKDPTRLYLEWHGQNGRTVVELHDPLLEFVDVVDEEQEIEDDDSLDDLADDDDRPGTRTPLASFERIDDDDLSEPEEVADADEEDPFGLFPADLKESLESKSSDWSPDVDDETLAQWKEWDEVFDGTKDVPLSSLFDPPIRLPASDSLSDDEVTALFRTILAQLALHNIAFHMCEHFTPRGAYELLRGHILPEHGAHPDLPRIGYTMNFDTAEFCDDCQEESERKYGKIDSDFDAGDSDANPDTDLPDDDIPL